MQKEIELLSQDTIDKIAAGEVVERPASVVKELVENAIDANANIISIEIKKGGLDEIRITDNGIGIPFDQVKKAFLRHSTSKIRNVDDLTLVKSLGFRGEALSSIAAVAKVELITKTRDDMLGSRYRIEGAKEIGLEEIGAPDGTTFFVRSLFYNTPARQKFLKSPKTEGSYIYEIVEKLALSHPEISFQLSIDNKQKLSTVGNASLKDAIFQVYGKEITNSIIEINHESDLFKLTGFVGEPIISRGNRAYENVFVNNRYVNSKMISKAIEAGYLGELMQHQYPFTCLFIDIDSDSIDVNVHPTKMEVRFDNQVDVAKNIEDTVYHALHKLEDIREFTVDVSEEVSSKQSIKLTDDVNVNPQEDIFTNVEKIKDTKEINDNVLLNQIVEPFEKNKFEQKKQVVEEEIQQNTNVKTSANYVDDQISFLSEEAVKAHKIIGQLFDTYWLIEFDNSLYIIDQHAAHEKVLYEKTLKKLCEKTINSQMISPPIIVTLSASEQDFFEEYKESFESLGYKVSSFGGKEYAINGIPDNLFNIDAKKLFLDMISECENINKKDKSEIILEKIASMSCKAAVKGNQRLSRIEIEKLMDDLLSLDNPYHCPHGRPTIIKMTQKELEKKFKRIV